MIPGGSSTGDPDAGRDRRRLDFDSLGAAAARRWARPASIVARRPRCMVQLGIRVSRVLRARVVRQVHAVPRGHALDDARSCASSRPATRDAGRPRPAARRLRPDHRQVPLPARRLRRDGRSRATSTKFRERVPARTSSSGGCPFGGDSSLDGDRSRRSTQHAHAPGARGARVSTPELVTLTIDGREVVGAEGHRPRRGGARGRDRDPRLLLRAAARAAGRRLPHVPRARSRPGRRSRRPRCTLTAADGMVVKTARTSEHGGARRRTRRSSSSSSTTRSTAPSATRAASARCRT